MNNLFVYCEIEEGIIADVSLELLTKGRSLANELNCQLEAVVAGTGLKEIEKQILPYGVDKLHVFDAEGLYPYTSLPHTSILVNLFKEEQPQICLMGATVIGRDLGPRVSSALTSGLTADAGVRITLTELNYFDLTNREWVIQQLHTMHHEFSHIIHQTYKMPNGFNKITEDTYTGQAWKDINTNAQAELIEKGISSPTTHEIDSVAQNMAIQRGMLTPYGTSSEFEDFAELVSLYLLTEPAVFEETYIASDPKRTFLDEGKANINKKLALVKEYYVSNFSIDLTHLREIILQRLNEISMK